MTGDTPCCNLPLHSRNQYLLGSF